jgi:tRNA(Arg) A34 adenosine deaminase TadA
LTRADQDITGQDREFMRLAIQTMRVAGVVERTGGPFGAVIVMNQKVVATAGNRVLSDHDPTAHAEISAIRAACRRLGTHDLSGAVLYTSCECCPMCYSAAYWARISRVFYAAALTDYADIFDDAALDLDIRKPNPERALNPRPLLRDEALAVWAEFRQLPDGARY